MLRICLDAIAHGKKKDNVKLTTRFSSGKKLMFAKLSLMIFIYDLVETFYLSHENVRKIYQKYLIKKVYVYHVLTETDSTCVKFLFVSSTDSDIPDKKLRGIIFEVIVARKIYEIFDSFMFSGKSLSKKRTSSKVSRLF